MSLSASSSRDDFRTLEDDTSPRRQDVARGVHVTIVTDAALANPTSHSQTLQPFRAADYTAIGTGLGTPSLADFDKRSAPNGRFVPEHVFERCPAGVEDGLCHPRFHQLGRAHIANGDQAVLAHERSRNLVEVVAPSVCHLPMNCAGTSRTSRHGAGPERRVRGRCARCRSRSTA